ncbi:hypothetical protein PRUPE_6G112100 [Prunus persica]|uniref:RNA 3'-terminal phosphate cyclase domain-containing protein n=1 Tax=Prunus persica TaxID=3760 RepID=A0A251NNM7_PRUPE|nr:hypothetical protein PRUPE_6G112100 [Prunus persica]
MAAGYKKLFGSQNLRQQLVLSTLTFTPIQIHDIRNNETWPGLRKYEVSLLKLLALVCHGCSFEINDTGNGFKFKPGIVMGGSKLEHDCGVERSIGSHGYGMSLVAETTSGCYISADTTISHARGEQISEVDSEKKELVPPKDVGLKIASVLLGEIGQGGVVDLNLQGLLFLLCALCPQDVSKVRVGKLSPYGIDTLKNINDFLGVKFVITPCASTSTVFLKCVGCGLRKLSRKIS